MLSSMRVWIRWKKCQQINPKSDRPKTFAHSDESKNIFKGFEINIKFCVFDAHIEILKEKNFLGSY